MAAGSRLREVADEPVEQTPNPATAAVDAAAQARAQQATAMLLTAVRALSQRVIVAAEALVDLLLIASAFTLWLLIIAQPTPAQLTGVGGYAVFVLAAVLIRRRRSA